MFEVELGNWGMVNFLSCEWPLGANADLLKKRPSYAKECGFSTRDFRCGREAVRRHDDSGQSQPARQECQTQASSESAEREARSRESPIRIGHSSAINWHLHGGDEATKRR